MKSNMQTLALLMMSAQAISAAINQQTADSHHAEKAHLRPVLHRSVGDSFFAKPVEGYPLENSLASTSAFFHSKKDKVIKLGEFEMDLLWVYVLVAIIVIGAVVGGIICCCAGGEDKPAEMMEKMEENKEEKKEDEENKMEDMMMGEEMMAAE